MSNSAPVATILMATFEGAAYLGAQIESLRAQTETRWRCLVRDDGSRDGTHEILRRWSQADPRVEIVDFDGERLGAMGSFARLLDLAPGPEPVFFCDQDDVWRPEKMAHLLKALHRAEKLSPDLPIAVHCDLELVGPNLEPIAASMKNQMGFEREGEAPFARLLAQNFVTGCAMAANFELVKRARPVPPDALMHDGWMALVAAATGRLVYVDEALVRYRQHGKNASGASVRKSVWRGAQELSRHPEKFTALMRRRRAQWKALAERLASLGAAGTSSGRLLESWLSALDRSGPGAVYWGLKHGIRMQGFARSAAFYALVLGGAAGPDRPEGS